MTPRYPAFTVALLGGESSGKTTLAMELQQHLSSAHGLQVVRVTEHLREWSEAAGRAPHAHEQAAVAEAQSQRIAAAQCRPGVDVVLADTTALMVAAYSALYFQDRSLLAPALAAQCHCHLTLLMGLDLPWVPDGLFRDSPSVRDATDGWLRRELQGAGMAFQTVYGQGPARLQQALRALGAALGRPLVAQDPALATGLRPWSCENCSDPDCEHRLFTGLLART
ncbi:AAA family ATPase [Hydrogenophaga laconesensis]|uniref:Nicotinamide riboside kinase n=1 Tax=Hydrogenophaga laconesensis TaxID=1805971 RepID=A0ABU1VEK3_9BURK|nr:AAA family ATPase [Hydrogenophaga laconesensis]MDR7095738.1 nicotinamide riboside kinase [Hydrogenophaga laconesensis]